MIAKVSVIIPTYNYGRFIAGAIEGALSQTAAPVEIVVVDDGSTDDTAAVVAEFGGRVRYIRQENAGVCAARNRGVAESTGELIAFLDADDTWEPTKLKRQAAKFAEDAAIGLVHCGMREFDSETGETIQIHVDGGEGWVAEELALWETPAVIVSGSTIVVSREAVEEVGGFDTEIKNGEDWEFCFRVAMKYKVGFVPEVLVNYRNHGSNATKNVAEMERSTMKAWAKVFSSREDSIRRLRRRSYGNLHKVLAGSYLQQREMGGFARNVLKSLWYRPSYIPFYARQLVGRRTKDVK